MRDCLLIASSELFFENLENTQIIFTNWSDKAINVPSSTYRERKQKMSAGTKNEQNVLLSVPLLR